MEKQKILLTIYRFLPLFNNWRLPKNLNYSVKEWQKIDHRKDRSLSGKDFRLWLYLRLNNKLAKLFGFRK